ncbi:MAG: methyltransferase domain-containing protein [Methylotenera sp.]|nr:methyltransferase domain-containing protein [Methylotenera sp.]
MKTFLHVGCGPIYINSVTQQPNRPQGFGVEEWNELRLDINPEVHPDVVGTMTDMSAVPSASVDAIFSSHNIEHLYPHEVPIALAEFRRVLRNDGFVVITCPDLQSVCALVAQGKLTEAAYISPAGPITPLDILYGYRPPMSKGNLYMAHRCGFTLNVLIATLESAGFSKVVGNCRPECFDLWALASVSDLDDAIVIKLASEYFPKQLNSSKIAAQTDHDSQQAVNDVLLVALEHERIGQIEQAEQLYLEILNIQPKHAEANHNLGVIEVHLKGAISALPRLERAVEVEPTNEQFWVTYLDALMQSGLTDSVADMLEFGQKYGLRAETAQMLAAEFGLTLESKQE